MMGSGSESPQIGKVEVLGNREPRFFLCRFPYFTVRMAGETFFLSSMNIMAEAC